MRDFTLTTYRRLLEALKAQHYQFQPFAEFLQNPAPKAVILRHDVDARKINSLATAKLEAELGIKGTYYFRIVPQSFNEEVIREIYRLGHEIGYHYEDLALARGDYEKAIALFTQHLAKLRQVEPISTICMHGSPLSRFDNRKLWDKYNYRDFGIIGEPYFDADFSKVMYLTDTGRRWDGERVSIRDKVKSEMIKTKSWEKGRGTGDEGQGTRDKGRGRNGYVEDSIGEGARDLENWRMGRTEDIIRLLNSGQMPDQMMITIHPQRWDDRMIPWTKELVFQNFKNLLKRFISR